MPFFIVVLSIFRQIVGQDFKISHDNHKLIVLSLLKITFTLHSTSYVICLLTKLRAQLLAFIFDYRINPLKPELNPICYLLALLGAHHFLHVSRIRVKSLTFRRLMS